MSAGASPCPVEDTPTYTTRLMRDAARSTEDVHWTDAVSGRHLNLVVCPHWEIDKPVKSSTSLILN